MSKFCFFRIEIYIYSPKTHLSTQKKKTISKKPNRVQNVERRKSQNTKKPRWKPESLELGFEWEGEILGLANRFSSVQPATGETAIWSHLSSRNRKVKIMLAASSDGGAPFFSPWKDPRNGKGNHDY